jgi:hypothetical protein
VIGYASRTGTRRNLAGLRDRGWRLLVSARGVLRHEGFRYALDNGAWTAHQRGEPFDEGAFTVALDKLAAGADWTVVPDIVAGGLASLAYSLAWLDRVLAACPAGALLAVQNGMETHHVAHLLGPRVGIFVGGDTAWKLSTLPAWCSLGRERGCIVHVGRVNSAKRIALCAYHGATSIDGSSASRYAVGLPGLDNARRQLALELER